MTSNLCPRKLSPMASTGMSDEEFKKFATDGLTCITFLTIIGKLSDQLPSLSPDHWTIVFKLATGTSSSVMSLNQLLATLAWVGDARTPHPSLKKYIEVAFCHLFVAPEEKSGTLSSWKPIPELVGVTTREEALKIFQRGNAVAFLTGTTHSVWYIFADTKNDNKVTCTKLLFEDGDKIVEEELPRFGYTKRGQVPDARVKFWYIRTANLKKNEPLLADILATREKQRLEFQDNIEKNMLVAHLSNREPLSAHTLDQVSKKFLDEDKKKKLVEQAADAKRHLESEKGVPWGLTDDDGELPADTLDEMSKKFLDEQPACTLSESGGPLQTHIMADLWHCAKHGGYRINTGDMTVPGCQLCGLKNEKAVSA